MRILDSPCCPPRASSNRIGPSIVHWSPAPRRRWVAVGVWGWRGWRPPRYHPHWNYSFKPEINLNQLELTLINLNRLRSDWPQTAVTSERALEGSRWRKRRSLMQWAGLSCIVGDGAERRRNSCVRERVVSGSSSPLSASTTTGVIFD